jgi:4-hydroxy-2-oxoheptanedioate aldolase
MYLEGSEAVDRAPAATLYDLINQNRALLGGWCAMPSSTSAEIMGSCGYDWICIDRQHGLVGDEDAVHMLQALAITSTPVVVRVPWSDPASIMRALDLGAQGVIIPMVNSSAAAADAARACRYPPLGYRSWGPLRLSMRAPGYSPTIANEHVICIVMVETEEGFQRLDEILEVPGVDGIFIGPNDLALATGLPLPREQTPAHTQLLESRIAAVLAACKRTNRAAGISCAGPEAAIKRSAEGFRLLALSADAALLSDGAKQMIAAVRSG